MAYQRKYVFNDKNSGKPGIAGGNRKSNDNKGWASGKNQNEIWLGAYSGITASENIQRFLKVKCKLVL